MNESFPIQGLTRFMPAVIGGAVGKLPVHILKEIEEVRLRLGRPLTAAGYGGEYFLDSQGRIVSQARAYIVTAEDLRSAVQLVCNFSVYSVEEELKNGFVTVSGGHRVGISGKAVLENGKVKSIRDIAFMNYRVAKQILGAADKVMGYIIRSPDQLCNTLIISPPQCGKTTLLRDIIRQLSTGVSQYGFRGRKIGLVDERSEIAACSFGIPENDVGIRTDVLDGCPKADGIIMMIRSMSPDVIATDEIGRPEDAEAIFDAINAGVKVITTIHGNDIEDFLRKPALQKLHRDLFERIIIMSRSRGAGTIEKVLDERGNSLTKPYHIVSGSENHVY